MGHYNVRIKVRRRRVAHLAAKSRNYIVIDKKCVYKQNRSISPIIKHNIYYTGDISNAITCPFTKHKFVPTNPHPIPGRFGITITGYDWVEPEVKLWQIPIERFKQTKRLVKLKKRMHGKEVILENERWPDNQYVTKVRKVKRQKRNDFIKFLNNNSHNLPKMNRVEYMEKLVEHKLLRWVKRNPAPIKQDDTQQDIFEKEFMLPWIQAKEKAETRFRDFVISLYDKLPLTGRFKLNSGNSAKFQEKMIAELKDTNGDGHKVNYLNPKKSKLLKEAQKITNKVHAKHPNLVCTNLRDHKRKTGRIILPQAA